MRPTIMFGAPQLSLDQSMDRINEIHMIWGFEHLVHHVNRVKLSKSITSEDHRDRTHRNTEFQIGHY